MSDLNEKLNNFKVSIIMPSYNQAKYLPETLDSVLAQSFENWECIIIDDGSADDTENVALSYCEKDNRFKYIRQENQGPSAARNNGISNSSGEYILPLDSDDLISKDYLKEALAVFEKNPNVKLVYCLAEFFGEKNEFWDLPEYSYEEILFRNMIFCSAMYRREDYDKTNGYNPNMREGLEDWDFWLSFLKKDYVVYRIPKVHFYYRIKSDSRNSLSNNNEDIIKKMHKRIFLNHQELYGDFINPIYTENTIKHLNQCVDVLRKENEDLRVGRIGMMKIFIKKEGEFTRFKNGLRFLIFHPEKFIKKRFNNLVKIFKNGK